jgi:hypothetical protein
MPCLELTSRILRRIQLNGIMIIFKRFCMVHQSSRRCLDIKYSDGQKVSCFVILSSSTSLFLSHVKRVMVSLSNIVFWIRKCYRWIFRSRHGKLSVRRNQAFVWSDDDREIVRPTKLLQRQPSFLWRNRIPIHRSNEREI